MQYAFIPLDDRGNMIACNFDYQNLKGFRLTINGSNNVITIASQPILHGNLVIHIKADNCKVSLGENIICQKNLFISLLSGGGGSQSSHLRCQIGNGTIFNGLTSIILAEKDNEVFIGDGCLFADNITITTSDSHKIYSLETGERINNAESIYIGHHVWIGENVKILKGATILNNSVCAIGSIVNKEFDVANVILAGIPAKIVRQGVYWEI